MGEGNEERKEFLADLVQIYSVQLSRLLTYSQIYHTRYMMLILADGLLCVKMRIVGLNFFLRNFNVFIWHTLILPALSLVL